MIPPITDALIADFVQTAGMMRAGEAYARQGRVGELDIDTDLMMVSASVQGSDRAPYWTSVLFADEAGTASSDSECSCPVGYGCKHVAAVLYMLRDARPHKPSLRIEAVNRALTPRRHAGLSDAVGAWLDKATIEDLAARIDHEAVRFVIEPKRFFKAPAKSKSGKAAAQAAPARFLLQIRAWRKPGGAAPWQVFHPYEWQYGRAIQIDAQARRLLARMGPVATGGDFTADKTPDGRYGWQWLCEVLHAGLLRWKKPDGSALTLAEQDRKARFVWQVLDDGRRTLALEGLDGLSIFVGDPAVWVDEVACEIGLIDTGLPPDVTGRLLALPPIAEVDIEVLASRWSDLVGDAVPAPALGDLAEIVQVAPRPVLHFLIDTLDCRVSDRRWHRESYQKSRSKLVRLSFDYAGHRIAAPEASARVFARDARGVVRIARDVDAEQAAVDRLAQMPLRPLAVADGIRVKPHQGWDHALAADAGTYPALLANEIAQLEREGWLIDYAPDWPHVWQSMEEATPGLELTPAEAQAGGQIDWFDLELPALIAGARIDILPALRRVLADEGEALLAHADDHQLALGLEGGRFTTIALGSVRPLLTTLLQLALTASTPTTLRVSRYDLGVVHDLSQGGVTWTSADALRRLAVALHDPDQIEHAAPAGLNADLRSYQHAGAAWLRALHGAGLGGILADDMGLGKTVQAIAHILLVRQTVRDSEKNTSPVLIVAPTSVLPNWQAELARFAPDLACLLWHGAARRAMKGTLAQVDVVLTSYPLLVRDKDILTQANYALAVLDEAHVLKNPATAGFKAAAALKAGQIVALTGTPLENRLTDIWALASLTNPGLLGTFEAFRKTYRTPIEKQGDLVARTALIGRLRPFLLRRTKDQVASELPPKTLIPEHIELTDAQMRLYESQRLLMHERVRQEIARVGLMRSQIIVLDAMLKLRQICCDPSLLPAGRGEGIASAKRARLLEMVPQLVGEGRRIIIFSQFTAMLDRLSNDLSGAGIEHEHLRGSTRDRVRPVRRFQQAEVAVILISLKAGGAGVNLTAADTVILYDPWWNPAVEAQAIDRAHRIGQTKPVFVHRMIATGTIEEKILTLQERKQDLADMLWSETGAVAGSGLDDEDIAFLLGCD